MKMLSKLYDFLTTKGLDIYLKSKVLGYALLFVILIVACVVSWLATCGLIYLVTLCFGWTFKWSVATGIWLLVFIIKSIFSKPSKK